MSEGIKTVLFPVGDVTAARKLYGELLGVEPHTDSPYYVGFNIGGQGIGLVQNGKDRGMTSGVPYVHVGDIAGSLRGLTDAGAVVVEAIQDVGHGRRTAIARDSDGNLIGLLQDK